MKATKKAATTYSLLEQVSRLENECHHLTAVNAQMGANLRFVQEHGYPPAALRDAVDAFVTGPVLLDASGGGGHKAEVLAERVVAWVKAWDEAAAPKAQVA